MNKLLILGTSLGSCAIVQSAQKRGMYTIVTDFLEPEQSLAKQIADEYWMLNTDDIDELAEQCEKAGVTAVFAGVSEFNYDRVLKLTTRLKLPCYIDPKAWAIARNKRLFKNLCRQYGLDIPADASIEDFSSPANKPIDFPVVVKPVDLNGNRGVSFCADAQEVQEAYAYARSLSRNPDIIIERKCIGVEYMAAYCVAENELSLLFMTRGFTQPGYPTNLYSVITSHVTKLEQYYKEVDAKAKQVLQATGVQDGLATIQFIRDQDGKFYATEMGHRLSADMIYEPFEQITGINTIGYMLDTVEGIKHTKDQLPPSVSMDATASANAYMFFADTGGTIQTIRGFDTLRAKEGYIVDMLRHPGDSVAKHSIMGKVVFKAKDTNHLCQCIDDINKTLQIVNEKGENMLIRFTDFDSIRTYVEQG